MTGQEVKFGDNDSPSDNEASMKSVNSAEGDNGAEIRPLALK